MNGILTVIHKEWRCFLGSDRGIFFVYGLLIVSWSIMMATGNGSDITTTGPIWIVFFSVVISANFSNTVFISERTNGILEILITSGLARRDILYGKMIFVIGMSTVTGMICLAFSPLWELVIPTETELAVNADSLLLYTSAVFMNAGNSAYLSIRMGNPRLLHIANILILAFITGLHSFAAIHTALSPVLLPFVLALLGAVSTVMARRLFESEKILQPVIL